MAGKPTGQVTLSLMDRLTDLEPKNKEEVALTRSQALRELKAGVRRDLEWLLNTRRVLDDDLPEHVSKSVQYYGLPEYSELAEDRTQIFRELARRMEQTIANYEPRLVGVKVVLSPNQNSAIRRVDLMIEGLLRVDPSPEHVSFDTSLDLTSGAYQVKGDSGAR